MTWSFWRAVVWLIVLASLGGYVCYVHVTRTQGATVVSTLLYLTPPTTMLWVFLMFGDARCTRVGLRRPRDQRRSGSGWCLRRPRAAPPPVRRSGPAGA